MKFLIVLALLVALAAAADCGAQSPLPNHVLQNRQIGDTIPDIANVGLCKEKCEAKSKCIGYSYNSDDELCQIHRIPGNNGVATPVANDSWDTYENCTPDNARRRV